VTRRQKTIAFFVTLCVLLVAAAVSLNVGCPAGEQSCKVAIALKLGRTTVAPRT